MSIFIINKCIIRKDDNMSEYIPIESKKKTIDDYWKELEDTEFDIYVAKQIKDEDMIEKATRHAKILERKIKSLQEEENEKN